MKNKVLLIVWVILLIGIFTLLSILGFKHKHNIESYQKYEQKLIDATKKYANNHKAYPEKGSSIKVKDTDLISEGFINKKDIIKGCKGTVTIKYDKFIDYIPNIKCKYYKTHKK
jgi:hypothetical protein